VGGLALPEFLSFLAFVSFFLRAIATSCERESRPLGIVALEDRPRLRTPESPGHLLLVRQGGDFGDLDGERGQKQIGNGGEESNTQVSGCLFLARMEVDEEQHGYRKM
jgi:hypothetical protein